MRKLENIQYYNFLNLVEWVFSKQELNLNDPDFNAIYKIAKSHKMENIMYYALKGNTCVSETVINALNEDHKLEVIKALSFDEEAMRIADELNKHQIKHMFMKGSVLKYDYPSLDMRPMADIDIFFDKEKAKEVREIFKELGYTNKNFGNGNHDVYMKKPFYNIEMHRALVSDASDLSHYYKDVVLRLENVKEFEYKFSNEDYYIFMLVHIAKHFSHGGVGVKSIIDVYIFNEKYWDSLNLDYIKAELEKIGLSMFEKNLKHLVSRWFEGDKFDPNDEEIIDAMEAYILESGAYGTISHDTMQKLNEDEKGSKSKYIFRRIFPKYKDMCIMFPVLKKWGILLPLFYVV